VSTDADPDLPSLRQPSPERRDAVVQALSDHFAAGRLELDELERRIELAVRAQTLAELDPLLADLQGPAPAVATPVPVTPVPSTTPIAPRSTVAVMSGTTRSGRWRLGPVHRASALMGATRLDLREADLTAEVTELRVTAIMGAHAIIVPPDIGVEVRGFALLGGIEDRTGGRAVPASRGAKRVVVRAFALMGRVEVRVQERPGPTEAAPGRPRLRP
jgi:hypothetical protein